MERVLHADDLDPLRMSVDVMVVAGELDRRFVRLRAAVAEEDPLQRLRVAHQLFRQADLRLGHVEVGGVPEEPRLFQHGLAHAGVGVADRDGGDAADEIEIALAVGVVDVRTLAADERDGLRPVVLEQHLLGSFDQLFVQANVVLPVGKQGKPIIKRRDARHKVSLYHDARRASRPAAENGPSL